MNRLLAILVIATLPTFAQAFPAFDIVRQKLESAPKPRAAAVPGAPCVDFSGSWVGSCTGPQGTNATTLNIKQHECDYISLDNKTYSIGGIVSESSSAATAAVNISYSFYWNHDQSVLIVDIEGLLKVIDPKTAPTKFSGNMEIMIDSAGALIVGGTVSGTSTTCNYTKQN